MNIENRILELLYWVQGEGLTPINFNGNDRFLNPITKRIATKTCLKSHQLSNNLWIPTVKGLKRFYPDIQLEKVGGMCLVTANGKLGAGLGESEAMLSLLNDIRQAA